MKNIRNFFFIIIAAAVIFSVLCFSGAGLYAEDVNYNQEPDSAPVEKTSDTVKIYFFYSFDCDSCHKVLESLDRMKMDNPGAVELQTYELSENDNTSLLFYLFERLGVEELDYKIPVIFLGDNIFLGEDEFNEGFENKFNEELARNKFEDSTGEFIGKYYAEASADKDISGINYIRLPAVIVSALADSINPCAIGVIIILISSIIASRNRKHALMIGMIYISVIFVMYFLLGIGFIYLTKSIDIPKLFYIILGSILIVLGLLSAKDFFWYQKGFSLGVPGPIKKVIEKNIYKATIISILIIGVLISIFEVTCSGAVYFGILSIISRTGMTLNSVLILLLYNFIFILPLLVILLVFYFGIPARKVQMIFRHRNRRVYRLILGFILVLLGIYLIVWL